MADPAQDPWHYRRNELANQILDSFESRLAAARTIFAPRRKGKTTFLQQDLMPMARERGWLVAYADLWLDRDRPEYVLSGAMAGALQDAALLQRVRAWWTTRKPARLKKLEANGKIGTESGLGMAVELDTEHVEVQLPYVFEQFRKAGNGKALLIIDEVQHLATRKTFENLTAQLRALLTATNGSVCAVFTGSSRQGLMEMFHRTRAPFFQYGSSIDFPDLGVELIQHFDRVFRQRTGRALPVISIHQLYEMRGLSPAYARKMVQFCLETDLTPQQADQRVLQELREMAGYSGEWLKLNDVDRAVLYIVVKKMKLYSDETLQRLTEIIGSPVAVHQVQSAIRKLGGRSWIWQPERGEAAIEDPLLETFILEQFPEQ